MAPAAASLVGRDQIAKFVCALMTVLDMVSAAMDHVSVPRAGLQSIVELKATRSTLDVPTSVLSIATTAVSQLSRTRARHVDKPVISTARKPALRHAQDRQNTSLTMFPPLTL